MLSSRNMNLRSKKFFDQSLKAFKAEMTSEPFLSSEMAFKMLSTSAYHFVRSTVNVGFAFYCIANTVDAVSKENDAENPFANGLTAIAQHIAAAAIDFANIFLTVFIVAARSIATLIKQADSNYPLEDRAADIITGLAENYLNVSLTSQGQAYNDASALDFSL